MGFSDDSVLIIVERIKIIMQDYTDTIFLTLRMIFILCIMVILFSYLFFRRNMYESDKDI